MKKKIKNNGTPTERKIHRSALMAIICNAILVIALFTTLFAYISSNNVYTYNQNVENISNIALAKSELLLSVLDNTSHELETAYRYCNGKSLSEILDYLSTIGKDDDEYQLLKYSEDTSTDMYTVYIGYSTKKKKGSFPEISYKNTILTGAIHKNAGKGNGVVSFSQGFTNQTDALRYFAVFCRVSVEENGTMTPYYLVLPHREDNVLQRLQMFSQYSELNTAVCYGDGKYLAQDEAFRAASFYDYLYKYNGLSIDRRNSIRESVQKDSDGNGVLRFKDYKNRDCVFAYASCGGSDNWHIIVSVPTNEFVSEKLFSLFPSIIILFLLILLAFNIIWLLGIVKELRLSVKREQIANKSKSSFLSRMSHEIRTPLNAVIGYNAIAKTTMLDTRNEAERKHAQMKVMDCLSKSEIASKHLLTVINDVLDMSAIESGKMQVENIRFDFRGLITSLTTVFYSQAKDKDVEFEVVFDTLTEEWFVGDQTRTNQILTNLLSNAIKFTSAGGQVKLKIQQLKTHKNSLHIHFEISDTGIGMSKEYLEHIWIPFEQADPSISRRFGGSGLGLSIVKNLVDLMGGSISVDSTLGKGTTFKVDLTFGRTEQPEQVGAYNFSSINALVVDDDINTCDYIRLLFNRCGAKCTAVTSGKDALKAVSAALEREEDYTVCLVDWRMPDMDGIETIKQIRSIAGERLPIIILTAYDFSEFADKAAESGVNKFLSKPLFHSSLFDLLANITGTSSAKSAAKHETIDFKGARVLLAEDNAMNMEIAKTIMESAGFTVDCAWNGKEALEKFEASEPGQYIVLLMDVHMPEMNGHDATRAIRSSSHPEAGTIPIIAMTADAFAENVEEAYACGMNGHIAKPIDIQTLFETLKRFVKL